MSQNTDNLLLSVINSKDAIKTALETKGIDMTDVAFSEYAGKIHLLGHLLDPGGDLWTPAEIDTWLWYDANDVDSITKDGSNRISAWNDKSGNARHATQLDAYTYRPTHFYDSVLAKWVVRFNGSNSYMNSTLSCIVNGATSIMMFIVCKRTVDPMYNFIVGGDDTNGHVYIGWSNSESLELSLRSVKSVSQLSYGYTSTDLPVFIISSYIDFVNSQIRIGVNGKAQAIATGFTNPTTNKFYLGRQGGVRFGGDIMEIVMVPTIDSVIRQKMEGYLNWKWKGVGIEYYPHPYNSYPPRIEV